MNVINNRQLPLTIPSASITTKEEENHIKPNTDNLGSPSIINGEAEPKKNMNIWNDSEIENLNEVSFDSKKQIQDHKNITNPFTCNLKSEFLYINIILAENKQKTTETTLNNFSLNNVNSLFPNSLYPIYPQDNKDLELSKLDQSEINRISHENNFGADQNSKIKLESETPNIAENINTHNVNKNNNNSEQNDEDNDDDEDDDTENLIRNTSSCGRNIS